LAIGRALVERGKIEALVRQRLDRGFLAPLAQHEAQRACIELGPARA
jgi:hypothetical protein